MWGGVAKLVLVGLPYSSSAVVERRGLAAMEVGVRRGGCAEEE